MRPTSRLPLQARQAAWDRLWRILLAPPASPDPGAETDPDAEFRVPSPGRNPDMRHGQ
jgi:hypothetical protein